MHRTRGELGKTTTTASFLPTYACSANMWPMNVVALLALVFAIAGQAKAEVLFAAVWEEQAGGPAFQARHNLTAGPIDILAAGPVNALHANGRSP